MEPSDVSRMRRNWRDERDSAALYRALAGAERNAALSSVFRKLALAEDEHAQFWERRLRAAGEPLPAFEPSLRTRLIAGLARRFGVGFVMPSIAAQELDERERYSGQGDAEAAGLVRDERGHAAVVRTIGSRHPSTEEERAKGAGSWSGHNLANNLRAAVLGANDGLVSNFCLLMGVAGGGVAKSAILLTGFAGLLAGACSMALGEWLSVTNTREMAARQVDREIELLRATPAHERKELALIYEARGLSEAEVQQAVETLLAGDPAAAEALARDEAGIDVSQMAASPLSAALVSFSLFALGAAVPLLPFFALPGHAGAIASAMLSLAALFGIGLLTSFFNGRSPAFSGLRQLGFGAAAAAVTFGAGRLFGALVGG